MKLNEAQISRTLSQFPAQVLAEDHPAVAQFCELFGHHTFFLDGRGLSVLELLQIPGIEAQEGEIMGWVNYFAVGHSSECFSFIKDWVEKKVRRHLAHARKRKGFYWKRWSRSWLYCGLERCGVHEAHHASARTNGCRHSLKRSSTLRRSPVCERRYQGPERALV